MDDAVLGAMVPSRVSRSWIAFGREHGIPAM
jgi:hypothetical protein